jgi:hypothetical protein
MMVIHIAYAIMKMPKPKGVVTIKADQRDTLACENASLSHVERFGDKAPKISWPRHRVTMPPPPPQDIAIQATNQ